MAGFDWDTFGKDAEKIAFANKLKDAESKAPTGTLDLGTGSTPEYQAPKLLGQAEREQAAADQVASTLPPPQQTVAPQAPAPAPAIQQPMAQPGMVPVQQTVSGISLPPSLLKKQGEIEQKALAAQDAATNAQIEQNNLLAEQAKAQRAQIELDNYNRAAQEAYDAEKVQKAQANVQLAIDDFNANKKVNPNRYKENMGTGQRIALAIAQGLGAFGAALTKSPNYALQLLQNAIDSDIRAQESDIAARGQAVGMANNMVAQFRQRGLDNQASLAAARMQMLQAAGAKVDEILAGSKNEQLIAQGMQLKAGLEKSYNDTMMHYGAKQVSTTKQNPAVGGSAGQQLPAKQAEDLGTANAAISAAEDIYNSWKKDASGISGAVASVIPGTDAKAFGDKRAMAKQVIGSYLEGGVLRKEDEEKYDKYLPEPGDSEKRALKKRDALIALISQRATAQKQAQKQAGFNVNGIEIKKPVTTFKPVE